LSSPTPAATGRSYHADLTAKNRRQHVHYLLEAGWKADTAIQGLGRSNRTNQAQPPLFRPIVVIGRLVSAAWVAQAAENDVPTHPAATSTDRIA
jgi:hypothetical protein